MDKLESKSSVNSTPISSPQIHRRVHDLPRTAYVLQNDRDPSQELLVTAYSHVGTASTSGISQGSRAATTMAGAESRIPVMPPWDVSGGNKEY